MSGASTRRILIASLVGTTIEFYDFYIYATAASLVFGQLFFPAESKSAQILFAFASISLAFFARPLGAIAFGHFGDRIGRKSTLVASLLLMGGSTALIAILPTYETAGALAPLLLCILRFGQGFGLGGEWGGAALLAVENAPPGWRGRFGMVPQLGAPLGFICANGLFLLIGLALTPEQFTAWGWRLPFATSIALVFLGLWIRLKLHETPAFKAAMAHEAPPKVPLATLFRDHLGPTLAGTLGVVACFALFYIATAFALSFGTNELGYSRTAFLQIQLGAILFMALGIVISGWWSDMASPRLVLIAGSAATIGVGALIGPVFGAGAAGAFAFLALALLVMGFVYGPLGAWLPGLFPAHVRYTGASLAFNVGGIIGGGGAPIAAKALADAGGLGLVGLYLGGAGLLSLVGLFASRSARDDLTA
ncbi:MFS transporter [Sphingomonas sp. ID0503]|uniref:MFS transporter n=1 Tax=Sphingomonas sp. ID0503 TaxID=3399691 RepID=UPI003AFB624C